MRSRFLSLSLMVLCVAAGHAHGQSDAAPGAPPRLARAQAASYLAPPPPLSGPQAPPIATPRSQPGAAPPLTQPGAAPDGPKLGMQPETIQPAPRAGGASPPPDPVPPQWGNYGQPTAVPMALPPLEYTLVGPPRGIIQPSGGQEFQSVVSNPDAVPAADGVLTKSINLFRADGLAPIGVFGDATLPTGRALLSYRYLQESFDDNFVGRHRVSEASVAANFTFAPKRMFRNSQVALLQYGVTDDFTILAWLPFQHNEIDYLTPTGGNLHTGFTNPGDMRLQGLYVLHRAPGRQLHLNFGMSVPVGMLETLSVMPSPVIPNLPYALRTSSGTYDLLPGLTYRGQSDYWSWGAQANGTIRLGINSLNYKPGDQVELTAWLSRLWTERWGTSLRIDSFCWGNVRQRDSRLNPTLAPTNDPGLQAGQRINLLLGINYYLPEGRFPGQRLSVEAGLPAYQSLDGPQLGLDWMINAGWNMIY